MKTKSISSELGFADSELLSYRRDGDTLMASVKLWNERTISLVFQGAVGISDLGAGDLSDIVEAEGREPFLAAVLNRVYEGHPANHPYRHFQFISSDGDVALEVVAETIQILSAAAG